MGPGSACADRPERFDYRAYLEVLKARGHNFIRLWRWEQFRSHAAGGSFHLCMAPQPWLRTGPGVAKDGEPKFDLSKFDRAFFDRLRERVVAAGNEGISVAVMLFDGWALHLSPAPDNVEGHPFHAANNVNGIGITSIVDYQVLPLEPRVRALQEAYIRQVVDAVHDLPNVLYEVANESSGGGTVDKNFAEMLGLGRPPDWGNSTAWQYWVIEFVKQYETGGRHPMAPGAPPSRWFDNPPASDGKKVVITDTDHYAPGKGDALWAWKSFLRGHNTILMDFGLIGGVNPSDPSYASFEPARFAMGDTRRYAERVQLIDMAPRADLTSTGAGSYDVEWYSVKARETKKERRVRVERDGSVRFMSPFAAPGPWVLYLSK